VIGALAIVVGISAAVFFFGGFYNVAGTVEDPAIVRWALIQVRTIDRSPCARSAPNLRQRFCQRAGRRQGIRRTGLRELSWRAWSIGRSIRNLHPDPPDLKEIVDHRSPSQLFRVVKNGINMTGMPSFALAGAKDDEIWSIVAFLKKLPGVSEADYKVWTAPPVAAPTPVPPTPPAVAPAPNPPRGKQIRREAATI